MGFYMLSHTDYEMHKLQDEYCKFLETECKCEGGEEDCCCWDFSEWYNEILEDLASSSVDDDQEIYA